MPFAGGNVGRMGSELLLVIYEQARDGDALARGAAVLMASAGGVCCAAALIIGFLAMTKK